MEAEKIVSTTPFPALQLIAASDYYILQIANPQQCTNAFWFSLNWVTSSFAVFIIMIPSLQQHEITEEINLLDQLVLWRESVRALNFLTNITMTWVYTSAQSPWNWKCNQLGEPAPRWPANPLKLSGRFHRLWSRVSLPAWLSAAASSASI